MQEKLLNIYLLIICFIPVKTIDVSTVEEQHKALGKARVAKL